MYLYNQVKRLAVSQETSGIFWSASEDGTVMQWDTRKGYTQVNTKGHYFKDCLVNIQFFFAQHWLDSIRQTDYPLSLLNTYFWFYSKKIYSSY